MFNCIVKQTREIGRAKLYKLNAENLVVKRFVALYDGILQQELLNAQEK